MALSDLERMQMILYVPRAPDGAAVFDDDDVGSIVTGDPQMAPRMMFQYWPSSVKQAIKMQKPKNTSGGSSRSFGGREPKALSLSLLLTSHPLVGKYDTEVVYDAANDSTYAPPTDLSKQVSIATRIDDLSKWSAERMLHVSSPRSGQDTLTALPRRFFNNSPVTPAVSLSLNFLLAATGLLKMFGKPVHPKFLLRWSRTDPFLCHVSKVSFTIKQASPGWDPIVVVANVSVVEATTTVSSSGAYEGYGGPAYFDTGTRRTADHKNVTFTRDALKEMIGNNRSE